MIGMGPHKRTHWQSQRPTHRPTYVYDHPAQRWVIYDHLLVYMHMHISHLRDRLLGYMITPHSGDPLTRRSSWLGDYVVSFMTMTCQLLSWLQVPYKKPFAFWKSPTNANTDSSTEFEKNDADRRSSRSDDGIWFTVLNASSRILDWFRVESSIAIYALKIRWEKLYNLFQIAHKGWRKSATLSSANAKFSTHDTNSAFLEIKELPMYCSCLAWSENFHV